MSPRHRARTVTATRTTRTIAFRSHEDKARWIDGAAWLDALSPEVQAVAAQLAGNMSNEDAARAVCDFVREHVTYTRDQWEDGTYGERIADAGTVLADRVEDCDGKARTVIALVRALRRPGLLARLRAVMEHGVFVHAQAEVSPDGGASWILAETIVARVPLGLGPAAGIDALGDLEIT